MTQKKLSPRTVYTEKRVFIDNPIFYVTEKTMSSEKKKEFNAHVVYFKPWVRVLVLDDDLMVYLNSEFRIATNEYSIECPGGVRESGETPEQAARREVKEELGVELSSLEYITTSCVAKSFVVGPTNLFIGHGTVKDKPTLDGAEYITLLKIPLEQAYTIMKKGEIDDSNTMILLYEAYQRYKLRI